MFLHGFFLLMCARPDAVSDAERYVAEHDLHSAVAKSLARVLKERPANPVSMLGRYLLEDRATSMKKTTVESAEKQKAASTIAGYMRCMSSKLKTSGRGEQNAEMMLVRRIAGKLTIEDCTHATHHCRHHCTCTLHGLACLLVCRKPACIASSSW